MDVQIPFGDKIIHAMHDSAKDAEALLIMGHGAGAPMTHSFMNSLSAAINSHGISTLRFNFPYIDSGRKSPGSPKPNIAAWGAVVEHALGKFKELIYISGKSYGGRMGSHLLAENDHDVKGIVYFGFPLHAPGRDSKDRANHLKDLKVPQLFIQGTKDALANYEMISEVVAENDAQMITIDGADHSFRIKGRKPTEVIEEMAQSTADWIHDKS